MRILRICRSGVAGIFFPIGLPKDGGTCQYSSEKCRKYCYAKEKDYDETLNIPEGDKQVILGYFVGNPIITVCSEIIKEMEQLQATILSWFVSGDCPDEHVERLYKIIMLLQEAGVVQNGFTRNKDLWKKLADSKNLNYDILRMVLTVESLNKGGTKAYCGHGAPNTVWATPNYKTGVVDLYHGVLGYEYTSYGSCSSNSYTHQEKFKGDSIEIASNCLGCFKRKIGCFFTSPEDKL